MQKHELETQQESPRLNFKAGDPIEEIARQTVVLASMRDECAEAWCEYGEVMTSPPDGSISSLVEKWRMMFELNLRSGKDRRKNPRFLHPYRAYQFEDRRVHPDRRVNALPASIAA